MPELKLKDVVLAESVWSESSFAKTQNGCEDTVLFPDAGLNEKILKTAEEGKKHLKLCRVHSGDVFIMTEVLAIIIKLSGNINVHVWIWRALRCSIMQKYLGKKLLAC